MQVGDPFAEKVLIECCLEIFAADLVTGIQDLGAAGLSCATTELAAAGSGGMEIDLDLAPLRDETLAPEEILMSESQERMMAVVTPDNLEAFLAICAKWDVTATVLGTVTDGDRLVMRWHGETIVDVAAGHPGPRRARSTGGRCAARTTRTRSTASTATACPGRSPASSCATPR